jgi:hypothetical protein
MSEELWFKEEVILKPLENKSDSKKGYRLCFHRLLEENETMDDVDQVQEYQDLLEGCNVPDYVDENLKDFDVDDIWDMFEVEELPTDCWEFYIGDNKGYPINE